MNDEGILDSIKRCLLNIIGVFYQRKTLFVFSLNLLKYSAQSVKDINNYNHTVVKESFLSDIPSLFQTMYITSPDLLVRFNEKKRCFIAMGSKSIAAYLWITSSSEFIPDVECRIDPPDGTIYIYNVRTKKPYRGQGIFTEMLKIVCNKMHSEEISVLYATILSNNIASIRAFEKCGFQKEGEIIYRKMLWKKTQEISKDIQSYIKCENA